MKHCTDVTIAMNQARNLMNDYAWNGEEKHYQRAKKRYEHYKSLHDAGQLYEPLY